MLFVLTAACGDDEGSVFSSSTGAVTTTITATTMTATTTIAATTTTVTAPTTTGATGTTIGNAGDLVESLASQLAVGDSPFDEEAAECFAQGVVDEIGFERMVTLGAANSGAAPEDVFAQMSEDEIDTIAGLGLGCLDMHALFVDQFVAQGLPQEVAVCIADGVAGAAFLHDMVVSAMLGDEVDPMADPEAMSLIMSLVSQCMAG
jgi:hypothetical protein